MLLVSVEQTATAVLVTFWLVLKKESFYHPGPRILFFARSQPRLALFLQCILKLPP